MLKSKFYKKTLFLSLALSVGVAHANDKKDLEKLQTKVEQQSQAYNNEIADITRSLKARANNYTGDVDQVTNVVGKKLKDSIPEDQQRYEGYEGALIFVSFSMPQNTLTAITEQAAKYKIPVIVKGLYHNDFRQTTKLITQVITDKGTKDPEGGIGIDPSWFDMYKIKQVPTFVLTNQQIPCSSINQDTCKIQNYDILYGNIPVKEALERFAQRGSFQDKALKILARGKS